MRYHVLCTDYDGTLATEGRLLPSTIEALEKLIASGRRLVMVTGRELDDLQSVCSRLDLFEYVVAENGALLYEPGTKAETPLAPRPPDAFAATLRQRGIDRVSVGRVIVATWEPHETTVLETIRDLGLELQVIFNKGAVMVLPAGVNKATGLARALQKMGLSARNAVGVGDAENDHALLALCECGVAVSNALPTLKDAADWVTRGDRGSGVAELVEHLLHDDLAFLEPKLARHHLTLGTDASGVQIGMRPYGENVLLLEPPGSGRSAILASLLETWSEKGFTFCLIDAQGDYETVGEAVLLGRPERPPSVEESVKLLRTPDESAILNLAGLGPTERSPFLSALGQQLQNLRASTGHPHWLAVDDTAQVFPRTSAPASKKRSATTQHDGPASAALLSSQSPRNMLWLTRQPADVAPEILKRVNLVLAVGDDARARIEELCRVSGIDVPVSDTVKSHRPKSGTGAGAHGYPKGGAEALVWRPQEPNSRPVSLSITLGKTPNTSLETRTSAAATVSAPTVAALVQTPR